MKKNLYVIAMAGILGLVFLLLTALSDVKAESKTGEAQQPKGESGQQTPDPYEGKVVLVEAFVVEVDTAELGKTKLSPLSQKPNTLIVDYILTCLNKQTAKVTAGAKLAIAHKRNAEIRTQQTKYFKHQSETQIQGTGQPVTQKSITYENHQESVYFRANAVLKQVDFVEVNFNLEQTYSIPQGIDSDSPIPSVSRTWHNTVSLKDGQPAIVGAIQDSGKSEFLIITANIQN